MDGIEYIDVVNRAAVNRETALAVIEAGGVLRVQNTSPPRRPLSVINTDIAWVVNGQEDPSLVGLGVDEVLQEIEHRVAAPSQELEPVPTADRLCPIRESAETIRAALLKQASDSTKIVCCRKGCQLWAHGNCGLIARDRP